jgi:cytochrome o ubiquinol oxidase subunit IV
MTESSEFRRDETAPGDPSVERREFAGGFNAYIIGALLAALLTVVSFTLPRLDLVWAPSIPIALAVLAIAQMGVHLVFFLHVTTGPDNVNNVLALAFGLLIVFLIIAGSLWIMHALDASMGRGGMNM